MLTAIALALTLAAPVLPVHGTVLQPRADGTAIVRLDAITGITGAQTRLVRLEPKLRAARGTGVDAFLDRGSNPWRLSNAAVAPQFTPGLPEQGKVFPVDIGSALPYARLVDQRGMLRDLSQIARGKVLMLAFIFTRCPDRDECPLLSSKFEQLQHDLDAQHFRLAEITLDPPYDSPAILAAYAQRYHADPARWSILTGQGHEVAHLLDRFGISSLRESDARMIHNDKVFLVGPDGKVADIVQTTQFSSGALAAQARHLAGEASNPLGRLELTLVAGAVALCGGSQFAGVVLLETCLFLIIAVISFFALSWIARTLRRNA